jgi:hypothetical protein
MMAVTVRLDPKVEIVVDDKGRIVLLPHDQRDPVRLAPHDRPLVEHLRDGTFDLEGHSSAAELSDSQRRRFSAIAVVVDRAGLLAGRQVAPDSRTVRFPALARVFDALAAGLTRPLVGALSARARGTLLQALSAGIVLALATLWWCNGGRMFAEAVTPHWWAGIALFLLVFPLAHEFSHALAGRLFGLSITMVGAQSRGGLSWSPFVEVRSAVLSSDPTVRIWIPLIGVVCNLLLTLLASLWLWSTAPGSAAAGIAAVVVALLHVRVLTDGGLGVRTDASQALRAADELMSPARARRLRRVVRGGYMAFLLSTLCMIALSFDAYGIVP